MIYMPTAIACDCCILAAGWQGKDDNAASMLDLHRPVYVSTNQFVAMSAINIVGHTHLTVFFDILPAAKSGGFWYQRD